MNDQMKAEAVLKAWDTARRWCFKCQDTTVCVFQRMPRAHGQLTNAEVWTTRCTKCDSTMYYGRRYTQKRLILNE